MCKIRRKPRSQSLYRDALVVSPWLITLAIMNDGFVAPVKDPVTLVRVVARAELTTLAAAA